MSPTRAVLIRHAKPEAPDAGLYPNDSLRPLAQAGIDTQKEMTERLKALGVRADRILHSPMKRAQQTAAIVAEGLGGVLENEPALGNDFDEQQLLPQITPDQTTIFVGHDPTLAAFANRLLNQNLLPSGMAKSGAVIVEFSGEIAYGQGNLVDYLTP